MHAEAPRTCPHCESLCPAHASICHACKRGLGALVPTRTLDACEIAQLERALEPLAGLAGAPPDRTGQPGRVRTESVAAMAVAAGSWGLIAASLSRTGALSPLGLLGVVVGVPATLAALVMVFNDLRQPAAGARRDARAAVRAYYRGVGRGLWASAYAALSPVGRNLRVEAPNDTLLRSEPGPHVRASPASLAQYWRTLTRPSGFLGRSRTLGRLSLERVHEGATVQVYRVDMKIVCASQWWIPALVLGGWFGLVIYLCTREAHVRRFDVVAHRYRAQWWVLCGELGVPVHTAEGVEGIAAEARRLANEPSSTFGLRLVADGRGE